MYRFRADEFSIWRAQARELLAHNILPLDVTWADASQENLFAEDTLPPVSAANVTVPPAFLPLAEAVACHNSPKRWDLIYQLLWRLTHGEKNLLRISTDPLMHALQHMEKAVRRDAHKMKAFVRFRLVKEEEREHYVAWHRPDHYIVKRVAPFFARRFSTMEWTILTPYASAHWNGEELHFGPGVPASEAPQEDILENLWRDYYRATFNPARIKLKTMKREMPVRHWRTLPETDIIAEMLAEAPARVEAMLAHQEGSMTSAADFLPPRKDLPHLRKAAAGCQGCELYAPATQTVFGEGPAHARLMLVGEQPGDQEDRQGHPFVGPAGHVLDAALEAAELSRTDIYITNAVKHFRFLYQESFRQHRSPSRHHINACKPWLEAEIHAVKPAAIVCLGNTAAQALISPGFIMKNGRGQWFGEAPAILASYHPSAILRARGPQREELTGYLAEDLRKAAQFAMSK